MYVHCTCLPTCRLCRALSSTTSYVGTCWRSGPLLYVRSRAGGTWTFLSARKREGSVNPRKESSSHLTGACIIYWYRQTGFWPFFVKPSLENRGFSLRRFLRISSNGGFSRAGLPPETNFLNDGSKFADLENFHVVMEGGPSPKALARREILAYGIGHMLNDLTAACWFTYLLIYLTDVRLTPREAALVMFSGQLADGIATILVGYLIDLFGHFKIWHGGGSLLVAISFSSVFGGCSVCVLTGSNTLVTETIGYSIFAAIFNMGWAATQVSHMSLVNCITANPTSRVALNSCRNAFTMIANLFLYGISFVVFTVKNADDVEEQYRWIAGATILIGGCFVLAFLLGVKEPRLQHHSQPKRFHSVLWFRKILYYQVALVYTLTRLTTNVSQALLAFYLIDDLLMANSSKAVVPAILYVCSFFTSIWLQESHWTSSKLKACFTTGAMLWIISGAAILCLPSSLQIYIYPLAAVIGIGNALMLVTATSMEGILVGHNLSGCAFVYGSLSLYDKLACGVALYAIESLHVESSVSNGRSSVSLVRMALALVPAGCALLGALIALTINFNVDSTIDCLSEPLLSPQQVMEADPVQQISSIGTSEEAIGSGTPRSEIIQIFPSESPTGMHLWRKMAHAMVGRWGSLRDSKPAWLE